MDEWQASDMAVALCGRRLRRRREHAIVGTVMVALAGLLASVLAIAPHHAASHYAWASALILAIAGFALFLHGHRFPTYGDAYRDLGLDPLTPAGLLEVDELLALRPDLRPTVACWSDYDIPLRVRDLGELRRLAEQEPSRQASEAQRFA